MKFSTVLKIVPYYIICVMLLIYMSISHLMNSVGNEKQILETQYEYISLAKQFKNNSDYLSRVMIAFLLTGDEKYENLYIEDITMDKVNKSITEKFKNLGLQDYEQQLANEILKTSDQIHSIERQYIPENIDEGSTAAIDLFSNDEYASLKFKLSEDVSAFNDYIVAKTTTMTEEAYGQTSQALGFLVAIVLLSITTLCALFYYYKVKLNTINGLLDSVVKLSDGDFDIDLSAYDSKDEFGMLANSFSVMIDSITCIVSDINYISEQQDLGNTGEMLDPESYSGAYREVANGINKLINSYNSMNESTYSFLKNLSIGNFDIEVPEFAGDRKAISDASKEALSSILRISEDITVLVDKASSGILENEIPHHMLQGDWKYILERIYLLPNTIFNQIIEAAPMAYFLIKDREVVSANKFAKTKLEFPSDENMRNFFNNIYDIYSREKGYKVEGQLLQIRMANGESRRFAIHISRIFNNDAFTDVVWGFDVEEREANNDQLMDSRDGLRGILETINVPIVVSMEDEYSIIYSNKAYRDKFRIHTDENDGYGISRYDYLPEYQPDGCYSVEAIDNLRRYVKDSGEDFEGEFTFQKSDGEVFDAAMSTISIVYFGQPAFLTVLHDITDEKKRLEILESAAAKEKDANMLKGRFLVNMSHEIRTPMNAIIGLSDVALLREQTPENYDIYHKINTSSRNLLNIINDILDFSKIEAEKLDLVNDVFLLEDIVANAFMVASERAVSKPIEMLLSIAEDVPLTLFGDKTRVWQVLKNLLDNSAKYTAVGKITLNISVVEEKSDADRISIKFTISDTGFGMSQEQLEKLFVAFEQFHNNAKNIASGTGLGMSIVKQLVDLMNGTIEVKSIENIGTTTDVIIPFKRVLDAKTISKSINQDVLAGEEVLIVDDDDYAVEIMENLVVLLGAKISVAKNTSKAIEFISKKNDVNEAFKLILIDYMIGNENGVDLANEIRNLVGDKSKLILVSAYSRTLIEDELKASRFNEIIQKPFMPSMFLRQLTDTVNDNVALNKNQFNTYKGAKILICEDNPINQDVAIAIFDVFGITPTIAENGEIGLAMVEKTKFDIIFMDILMPVMDGHQTTKAIRALPDGSRNKHTPILAMTANVMTDVIDQCMEEGMQGCVGKPIDIKELAEALDTYLPKSVKSIETEVKTESPDIVRIDDIDTEEGVLRFGGKKETYYKMLIKYAYESPIEDEPYEEKIMPENIEKFKMEIHSLKGVSGNLGIKNLFELCKTFESDLISGEASKEMYETILKTRSKIKLDILEKLADYVEVSEEAHDIGTKEEFFEILEGLKTALEEFEVESSESFIKLLKSKKWENIEADEVKTLSDYIESYQFDEAGEFIKEISEK